MGAGSKGPTPCVILPKHCRWYSLTPIEINRFSRYRKHTSLPLSGQRCGLHPGGPGHRRCHHFSWDSLRGRSGRESSSASQCRRASERIADRRSEAAMNHLFTCSRFSLTSVMHCITILLKSEKPKPPARVGRRSKASAKSLKGDQFP